MYIVFYTANFPNLSEMSEESFIPKNRYLDLFLMFSLQTIIYKMHSSLLSFALKRSDFRSAWNFVMSKFLSCYFEKQRLFRS